MNEIIKDLAVKFKEKKAEYETLKSELEECEKEWNDIEAQMQAEFTELGVKTVNLEGIGAFTMSTENYMSLAKANEESFFNYMKENGHGGLIKETVHSATMKAFLREHLEELAAQELEAIELNRRAELEAADEEEREIIKAGMVVDAKELAVKKLMDMGCSNFSKKGIKFKPEKKAIS